MKIFYFDDEVVDSTDEQPSEIVVARKWNKSVMDELAKRNKHSAGCEAVTVEGCTPFGFAYRIGKLREVLFKAKIPIKKIHYILESFEDNAKAFNEEPFLDYITRTSCPESEYDVHNGPLVFFVAKSFNWSETTEGSHFWSRIDVLWRKALGADHSEWKNLRLNDFNEGNI